ncbi:tRNA (uridine(54)-C5)-methyltransferase TrmA [Porticoccus sp. W117]|uniref:tRNA (uridine(54)-C5)-methyltransferase TrmA n=1 Tax=Porticoccus sp. W117 TaxID=3054777 RepID=UPI002591843E|nr:tRNA (uridine(54)-C5)-methyltransferase TrmA [Porticoccus sp. W117]MDM3871212.1 tRNA (uridine(54)-C5)-methyltransferase TrmA [Porticoccus sp. W117]
MLNHIHTSQYQQQLDEKIARLREDFSNLELPDVAVYPSQPSHFRMRAEFRIWHEGEQSFYAMHKPGGSRPIPIDDFPIGSEKINQLMPAVMAGIHGNEVLRRKLYVVEFLTTLSGDALVTLIYHKPLDEAWQAEARLLSEAIGAPIIGRSKKQKVVLDRDYVTEELTVLGRQYKYKQVETGFTQPNAGVNEKMLAWSVGNSKDNGGDLLELYCGNGNFTLPLAQNFNRVLATEISKVSVNSSHWSMEQNGVSNIDIVRMSSEDFTDALNKVRPFRRLKDIDLDSYSFSTVFVDPPRAGLDGGAVELVKRFDHILYISCNPETLKNNLEALSETHRIEKFAAFDQFPYTHHLECGALLTKK